MNIAALEDRRDRLRAELETANRDVKTALDAHPDIAALIAHESDLAGMLRETEYWLRQATEAQPAP